MTLLSAQTIRRLGLFEPCHPRTRCPMTGMTHGLGPSGYDLTIAEDLELAPGAFALASTRERFSFPDDVAATIHDKSTLARMGLTVQTTVGEPGWRGYLTLELSNNHPPFSWAPEEFLARRDPQSYESRQALALVAEHRSEYTLQHTIRLRAGQPIAQVLCWRLDEPTEQPYAGRYQDQEPGAQVARFLSEGEQA